VFSSPDAWSSSNSAVYGTSSAVFKKHGFPKQSTLPVTNFIVEVAPVNGE
jgi:hypothetical protein